jgi:hypothetical protein
VHGAGRPFAIFNLLSATMELAESAREKREADATVTRLTPCMQQLAANWDRSGYRPMLQRSLQLAAAGRGITLDLIDDGSGAGREPVARLEADAPLVRLVAGGAEQSLALELVVDLRLRDAPSDALRYGSLLSFGPELRARTPFTDRSPLYLRPVTERPTAHPVADWCGEGGPALLTQELEAGLRSIAAQFVLDLDRTGTAPADPRAPDR